ncbi:guanylate-binding N-terminal domain-containing protein [Cryptosporidium andersoni]|uniref:Guanylate-binding N-terminal domain-containing protein n=1 Tax=Cryptosporidium andersoni TaxID=117008 RepID=A0A1J4MIK6_9CRYT|nr:guanylate-binding N-terminal domain-containing protein [Cryptosporidium andersoni]
MLFLYKILYKYYFILYIFTYFIYNVNCKAIQLISIRNDGKLELINETTEIMKNIKSPISIISSVGQLSSGKSSLLNQLLDIKDAFNVCDSLMGCTKGIWIWSDTLINKNNKHILIFDTEGIFSSNSFNYGIKIFFISILLSDKILINSYRNIDNIIINTYDILIRQSLLIFTFMIGNIIEIIEKDNNNTSIKYNIYNKNLLELLTNFKNKRFNFIIHNVLSNINLEEYKYWINNLNKNIELNKGFFKDLDLLILPIVDNNLEYKDINKIDIMKEIRENILDIDNGDNILIKSGFDLINILEIIIEIINLSIFPEIILSFEKLLNIDIIRFKNNLINNYNYQLRNKILELNIPILEKESDKIYSNLINSISFIWNNIIGYNNEYNNIYEDLILNLENIYNKIMQENCKKIMLYCSKLTDSYISIILDKINNIEENIPYNEDDLLNIISELRNNIQDDFMNWVIIYHKNKNLEINEYENSKCCNYSIDNLLNMIDNRIIDLKNKNKLKIEDFVILGWNKSQEVIKEILNSDNKFYMINRIKFEDNINEIFDNIWGLFSQYSNITIGNKLYDKYKIQLNSNMNLIFEKLRLRWLEVCKDISFSTARDLSIKLNINIRSKLVFPCTDEMIFSIIKEYQDKIIEEMKNLYCVNEIPWNDAIEDLLNTINDDKEQLLKENIEAFKNLLYRPLQYALKNVSNLVNFSYNWDNFAKEASLTAYKILNESVNEYPIYINESIKEKVIEIWLKYDVGYLYHITLWNKLEIIIKFIFFLIGIIISFIIIFNNCQSHIFIIFNLIILLLIFFICFHINILYKLFSRYFEYLVLLNYDIILEYLFITNLYLKIIFITVLFLIIIYIIWKYFICNLLQNKIERPYESNIVVRTFNF